MALLELIDVTRYFGGLVALTNVSFQIDKGLIVGLIGPNGAGKTTLLNIVSGFMQPSKGRLIFDGEDITDKSPEPLVRRGIVRTFQSAGLWESKSVTEAINLAHHLKLKAGIFGSLFSTTSYRNQENEIEQKTKQIVEMMGLNEVKDELMRNLPHGYLRALGVAIALAAEPKLLLLDEPMTGMSASEIQFMANRLEELNHHGMTILIVEHNVRAIMSLCHRVLVLNFGEKIAEGPPEEVKESPAVIQAYLGADEDVT